MTSIGGHDLRERDDGTVTVTVSVERTGVFSRVVGVLFGGRPVAASTWGPPGSSAAANGRRRE
jgi:hypothetical protein